VECRHPRTAAGRIIMRDPQKKLVDWLGDVIRSVVCQSVAVVVFVNYVPLPWSALIVMSPRFVLFAGLGYLSPPLSRMAEGTD